LAAEPEHPLAANNLAFLLLEHGGNVDEAVSLAQTARRRLPDNPATADTLAWAFYHKGAYASAIDLLKEALKKTPNNATYNYHLGLAYRKSGDDKMARQHLQRALQLDPENARAADIRKTLTEIGGS
jgi:tetratricopeptide (TPR) repeat protein